MFRRFVFGVVATILAVRLRRPVHRPHSGQCRCLHVARPQVSHPGQSIAASLSASSAAGSTAATPAKSATTLTASYIAAGEQVLDWLLDAPGPNTSAPAPGGIAR